MKWIGQHIWDFVSRFRNDVYLEDLDASSGTSALVVDAQGKVHINTGLATGGGSEYVSLPVRFEEAVSKGDPVYISGYHGSVGPVIVAKADASSASHMPAFGLADADYTQNSTGHAISIGNLQDIDTSDYSVGDTLYVASGGGLTNVKPTGANLIQNVATVSRSNANNGQLEVVATGRTNDVPAPLYIDHANQRVGIGATSPGEKLEVNGNIKIGDNQRIAFGSGDDLRITHDSTNSYIQNFTGHLNIINQADDKDIIFKSDDGSGGVETYFFLDGSNGLTTFPDNKKLGFGNASDLRIQHDGSDSYISQVGTGNLYIQNSVDDKDIIFQSDDGSGGVTTYLAIDGSTNRVNFNKPIKIVDSTAINIGSGLDLRLTHDGTDSLIQNFEGNLEIQQRADDKDIILMSDDGSGGQTAYLTLDGTNVRTKFHKTVNLEDDVQLQIGNSQDLKLYHSGTHSYISQEGVGDLYIQTLTDDRDIIFLSDDGSGGVAEYFRIDGGLGHTTISKRLRANDNVDFAVGTGNDLRLVHDGTHSYMTNYTGDFYIANHSDDKHIIFQSDDGSGGLAEYFRVHGGAEIVLFSKEARFADNVKLKLGTGPDFELYHNGTSSVIQDLTGDLYYRTWAGSMIFEQNQNDGDIIFKSDDGSGGVETYFFLDGSEGVVNFPDNKRLTFGTGRDLFLYHDGTNATFKNYVGDIVIQNEANDKDIIFKSDDGSGGVTEYFRLDGSVGAGSTVHTVFPDNSKAVFGTGLDTQIYHDGSNSYIKQQGGGDLYIQQTTDDKDIVLQSDDGSGGVTAYLTLDGSAVANKFSEKVQIYKLDATANPRLSIGRQAQESINFDVEDRTARIYHRQDETTGNHVLKLTVDSDTSDTKDIHLGFRDADGSNESIKFTVDESGNVGVGTTDPSEKLHIVGDLKVATNADAGVIHFGDTSDETKIVGYDSSDSNTRFDFFTSGSKKLTILDSGNVGIGTDSPSEKLEVDGNIKLSGNLDIEGSVQKQIQVFPMNFVDDLGTDKHFMPFVTANEQTANYQEEACMVMPADGRVVSVTVHYAQMHGAASDITVGIETSPCGQSYTNAWTIEETETISASADDDHHVFHFAFDNAKHFESTDKMALSIQQSVDLQNANRFFWVTAVIEYNWSTYLGGTSAEYPTTP